MNDQSVKEPVFERTPTTVTAPRRRATRHMRLPHPRAAPRPPAASARSPRGKATGSRRARSSRCSTISSIGTFVSTMARSATQAQLMLFFVNPIQPFTYLSLGNILDGAIRPLDRLLTVP